VAWRKNQLVVYATRHAVWPNALSPAFALALAAVVFAAIHAAKNGATKWVGPL